MPGFLNYFNKKRAVNEGFLEEQEELIKKGKSSLFSNHFANAERYFQEACEVKNFGLSDAKTQELTYYLAVAQLGVKLKSLAARTERAREVLFTKRTNQAVNSELLEEIIASFTEVQAGPLPLPGVRYALDVLIPQMQKNLADEKQGKDNVQLFKSLYAKFKLYYLTKWITQEFLNSNNFDQSLAHFMLIRKDNVKKIKSLAKSEDDFLYFSKDKIKDLYRLVLASNYPDSDEYSPFFQLKKHLLADSLSPQQEKLFELVFNVDILWLASSADLDVLLPLIKKLQEKNLWNSALNQSVLAILNSSDEFFPSFHALLAVVQSSQLQDKNKLLKALLRFSLAKMPHAALTNDEFADFLELLAGSYERPKEVNLKRLLMYLDIFMLYSDSLAKEQYNFSAVCNLLSEAENNLGEELFAQLIGRVLAGKQYHAYFLPLMNYGLQLNKQKISRLFELLDLGSSWDKIKDEMKLQLWAAHQDKYPERPLDEVINEFAHSDYPLRADELADLKRQYERIKEFGKEIISSNLSLPELLDELKQSPNDETKKLRLIAVLREQIKEYFHINPYNVQIINLLALLKEPRRIAQIKTGEGKSTLIAMLSAFYALNAQKVDVVSTSNELAIRDAKKFQGFYKQLGLSVAHNADVEGDKAAAVYACDIVYGTNYNFEFAYLHQETGGARSRGSRPYDVVIVDEVDSMFIDMKNNEAIISIPDEEKQATEVYNIIWEWMSKTKEEDRSAEELQAMLVEQNIVLPLKQAQKWFDSAETAMSYTEGVQYVIDKDKGKDRVKIVDFRNTGQISSANSRWQNGLHSFLEVKHNLDVLPESLTWAAVNHIEFFNKYKVLAGLSGTVGSAACREELKNLYGVQCYNSPSYKPSLKKPLPNIIAEDDEEQNAELEKTIAAMVKDGRPCLILCYSIDKSYELYDLLKKKYKKSVQLYNCRQEESTESLLALAGNPGMITVSTNAAGRGTDIVLTPQAELFGGLHVILTFPAVNDRVEEQAFGRTGRQGRAGTYHYILNTEQLPRYDLALDIICFSTSEQFNAMVNNRKKVEEELSANAMKYYGLGHTKFILQSLFFKLPLHLKTKYKREFACYQTQLREVAADYVSKGKLTLDKSASDPNSSNRSLESNEHVNKYFCTQFLNFWNRFISPEFSAEDSISPLDFAYLKQDDEAITLLQQYLPQLLAVKKKCPELPQASEAKLSMKLPSRLSDDVAALSQLSLLTRKAVAKPGLQLALAGASLAF